MDDLDSMNPLDMPEDLDFAGFDGEFSIPFEHILSYRYFLSTYNHCLHFNQLCSCRALEQVQ